MDPQLDSLIEPKAQRLLHMKCDFHRALYVKIIFEDLESTRAHSLGVAKEVLGRCVLGEV